ncbi:MAG TPA: isoprenyl transferase [Alphaproteobacteria bacterium]|nr:isoprenyl transferase [Alphaproteobacteria bacterium]
MSDVPQSQPAPGGTGRPPAHVAIIMDGNGRWARARGLPRVAGHKRGAEAVRRTIRAAAELGIRYLTLFGFSSENWKRPADEVNDLMGLLRHYLRAELAELHQNGVRIRIIGDRSRLAPDIVSLIENAETTTAANSGLTLIVALSYGARAEIAMAVRSLARRLAAGEIAASDIDEDAVAASLWTRAIPDPDLIIRSSGEKRLSNFLLWQSAYSELVFVDTLWPDFGKDDLMAAIHEFHRRERRYGAAGG